jgi:hypothetical protein
MAKDTKSPQQVPQKPSNVVPMTARLGCTAEGCKKPDTKLNFCNEHYEWYKVGLINKAGQKPKDFDKKYRAFMKKHKQAA